MNDRTKGFYTVAEIANLLNVSDDTINKFVKVHAVPFRRPSGLKGTRYFDMSDFWASIPKITPGAE